MLLPELSRELGAETRALGLEDVARLFGLLPSEVRTTSSLTRALWFRLLRGIFSQPRPVKEVAHSLSAFALCENDTARLQHILTAEYGYVLPYVAAVQHWELRVCDVDLVQTPGEMLDTVDQDVIAAYRELLDSPVVQSLHDFWPGVIGFLRTNTTEPHVRLIDGRHRFIAHYQTGNRNIIMIVPKLG